MAQFHSIHNNRHNIKIHCVILHSQSHIYVVQDDFTKISDDKILVISGSEETPLTFQ